MALAAIPVGFSAGFFGIGGGLISVPVLFYSFESLGLNSDYIMHLAIGTSFSIIVPTSISSVLTHNKFNAVDFNVVKSFGLFVIIGVVFGTIFASTLETRQLVLLFSIVTFCLGNYLIFSKEKEVNSISIFKTQYKFFFGLISGFISGQMGIGGAIMNVPVLKFFGYNINKAIGSAAAIGFLIAITGTLGFLLTGNYKEVDAPLSVGFVNIPAFLIFVPITIFMAKLGAKTVHKLDKKLITKLFGLLNIFVSIRLFLEYLSF
jgi:uncharacterized membrane protein YfcA|tara:strand:+ start:1313 stop:2098 length:786 start_codon:yes stop_codon:yes gene_type:complete